MEGVIPLVFSNARIEAVRGFYMQRAVLMAIFRINTVTDIITPVVSAIFSDGKSWRFCNRSKFLL